LTTSQLVFCQASSPRQGRPLSSSSALARRVQRHSHPCQSRVPIRRCPSRLSSGVPRRIWWVPTCRWCKCNMCRTRQGCCSGRLRTDEGSEHLLALASADSVGFYTCPGHLPSGRMDLLRPASPGERRDHPGRATSLTRLSHTSSTCHTAPDP